MIPLPKRLLAVALVLASAPLAATPLDAALDESQQLAADAKASQARVEQLDDASREMLTEYRNALQQAEALQGYNAQLRELVAAQRKELTGYQEQLDGIERTGGGNATDAPHGRGAGRVYRCRSAVPAG